MVLALIVTAAASDTLEGYTFFYGDPHAHTGVSGDGQSADLGDGCENGCGTFAGIFEETRTNGLDWVVLSDHSNGISTSTALDFAMLWQRVLENDDEGEGPVVVPGAEVWFTFDGAQVGHKNVMFFGPDEELRALSMTDLQPSGSVDDDVGNCDALADWIGYLAGTFGDVLLIPHHMAIDVPMVTDWTCHQPEYEVAAEVYSGWGNMLGDPTGYDPPLTPIFDANTMFTALDPDGLGLKMGFLGGSDYHGSIPGERCKIGGDHASTGGLSVVILEEGVPLTRQSLHDAIVARHTIASSGPKVPVLVEYRVGGDVVGRVGDDIELERGETLAITLRTNKRSAEAARGAFVVTPDGMTPMEQPGTQRWTATIPSGEAPAWFYVAIQWDGVAMYAEDFCDDGGSDDDEWAWTSPSWITVR